MSITILKKSYIYLSAVILLVLLSGSFFVKPHIAYAGCSGEMSLLKFAGGNGPPTVISSSSNVTFSPSDHFELQYHTAGCAPTLGSATYVVGLIYNSNKQTLDSGPIEVNNPGYDLVTPSSEGFYTYVLQVTSSGLAGGTELYLTLGINYKVESSSKPPRGTNSNSNSGNANSNSGNGNSNANPGIPNSQINTGTSFTLGNLDDNLGTFGNLLNVESIPELIAVLTKILFFIIGLAAVIVIIVSGFRMVLAQGNEAALTKAKAAITWAIMGLIVSILAFSIVAIVQRIIQTKL
ncbi:MAG TPA: pilin [Patescibacteria group bacterium]|nr:pilin [Patescibacteria group bacterium]